MGELVNTFADVFAKPGKPVAQYIKYRIELLDPKKPLLHHKLQKVSEREFKKVLKHL